MGRRLMQISNSPASERDENGDNKRLPREPKPSLLACWDKVIVCGLRLMGGISTVNLNLAAN